MKFGSTKAFRDLAVFILIFAVLVALTRNGMPDISGLVWWGLVLSASAYLIWKGLAARGAGDESRGRGGWGAVLPPKLWRWMAGEDDETR